MYPLIQLASLGRTPVSMSVQISTLLSIKKETMSMSLLSLIRRTFMVMVLICPVGVSGVSSSPIAMLLSFMNSGVAWFSFTL